MWGVILVLKFIVGLVWSIGFILLCLFFLSCYCLEYVVFKYLCVNICIKVSFFENLINDKLF